MSKQIRQEEIKHFFSDHPEIDSKVFCRQTILREINRYQKDMSIRFFGETHGYKGKRVYKSVCPAWLPEDLEVLERFFQENRQIKKGDFFRDVIIREISKYRVQQTGEAL